MNREQLYQCIGVLDEDLLERSEKNTGLSAADRKTGEGTDRKIIREADRGTDRKIIREADREAEEKASRETDGGTEGKASREIDGEREEKVSGETGRGTDKRTGRRTDRKANGTGKRQKKGKCLIKWLTVAACIALLISGAAEALDRLDYLRMGCSAWAGTLVDGVYYYNVAHSGVWRYTREDGASRVVSAWEEDGWQVNEYGVYYTQGRSLYVREHDSGVKRRLYRAGFLESTDISFTMMADGNAIVTVYNKRKDEVFELLLDGVTGEKLGTVTEKTSYGVDTLLYSQTLVQVGDRNLMLVKEEGAYRYDLLENGESLLPEGRKVNGKNWFKYGGESLYVPFWEEEDSAVVSYLVLRPDGDDSILENGRRSFLTTGTDDFLFYCIGESAANSLWCMEAATGECWQMEKDNEIVIYDMVTDGEWMFTCVPWSEEHVCWRLIYDENGRPAALELVSGDIGAEKTGATP